MVNKVLVVAAHPDDDVIGCGGTIAKHANLNDEIRVLFLADGVSSRSNNYHSEKLRRQESAKSSLNILGVTNMVFLDLKDNQLDSYPLLDIVQKIESVCRGFEPNIIYTHHYDDLNIDHAIACKATLTAFRPIPGYSPCQILMFEVPSASGWGVKRSSFNPNVYNDISQFWDQKKEALTSYMEEMREYPHARSLESLESLARYRGASVGIDLAESFELCRWIIK